MRVNSPDNRKHSIAEVHIYSDDTVFTVDTEYSLLERLIDLLLLLIDQLM